MNKLSVFMFLMVLVNLSWADDDTTTLESVINTEKGSGNSQAESGIVCSAAGVFADESDCRKYHECTSVGSEDGSLQLLTKSCPVAEAFSSTANRCSRDISSCDLEVKCISKGLVVDPHSKSSYYVCQPKYSGSGFYIFHVNCGPNKVFDPDFGLCLNNPNGPLALGQNINEPEDAIAIKMELKRLKNDFKEDLKKENDRIKTQKKLQKVANQRQKLEQKLEANAFTCEKEGNFPSKIADNLYIACFYNDEKISAIPASCSLDAKFNPQTGSCDKTK